MFEIAYLTVLSVGAFVIPIIGIMLVLVAVQFTKKRQTGFMHFVPYFVLLVIVADVLFSGRSLDNAFLDSGLEMGRSSINMWLVRASSVFILMASLERIFTTAMKNGHILGRRPGLTLSFIGFWFGSVGIPMFFSAHPYFSHDFTYSLIIGVAVLSLTQEESIEFILSLRNALFLVILAGLLMIPIHPEMVMETNYSQGFIPGLPRFAGLVPHAVVQGAVALFMLLILYVYPLKNKTVNRFAWLIGIAALFMAQSKTAWISAVVSLGILFWLNYGSSDSEINVKTRAGKLFTTIIVVFTISLFGGLIFVFGDVGTRLDRFLFSSEGHQLTSLTGRDIIWEFALKEWAKYPILGYGPPFLNLEQRISIGWLNATHAHNQYIDTLARSGLVGLLSLLIYLITMILTITKTVRASKPLIFAIFLFLFFRSISEVPFSIFGYGVELLFQFGLLALILGGLPNSPKKNFSMPLSEKREH